MVLHWRRCGRAGGCQEQKRKRQIRCREKFIIDTGKDEQQLITANPYSRAVLFMITLVLPVIRGLNESSGFWWLIKHQSEKQNILKFMEASFQRIKYLFCNVPWKPHIRNWWKYQDIRGDCYKQETVVTVTTLWRKQSKKLTWTNACNAIHVWKESRSRGSLQVGYAWKSAGWMPWH